MFFKWISCPGNLLSGNGIGYRSVVFPFLHSRTKGDDIVILDSLVAAKYRELLDDLGVQIEPMKSLSLELALLSLQNDYGSAEDKESHLFLSV
ncbi:hypothetical protein L1987_89309 [Smallanthus sonchifolius]|nr:hypothetical protein L1987_89309 [Smallanthus sonchifolius]